ncbi:MAG: tRNA uridine-5-carboxymethylaminomethyl(34) synthesis GTPase MnmE [Magnetococcales bacterium]|nr:tRNA uridine-5-carboxymethylaminomethyl(34) synthesis GTPase MnmE [Magnetococcales bacterium]
MSVFLNQDRECICALATPWGQSAIAVIRLSGTGCGKKLNNHFVPRLNENEFNKRFVRFAKFFDHQGQLLDQVVLIHFPGPNSFTGEDVFEIQCHGSPVIVEAILDTLGMAGFRLAKGGEFSKRAFLNGKMDLLQAESIQQLIAANNLQSVRENVRKLDGFLSKMVQDLQSRLTDILAHMEVAIDFSEDDGDSLSTEDLCRNMASLSEWIGQKLRESHIVEQSNRIPNCVIVGRPNVGKSTLFNALVGMQRAIVSQVAGTTRDYIQEVITIDHLQIKVCDTAGIRCDAEGIEQMGIQRSLELFHASDLILLVVDACDGWTREDMELLQKTNGFCRIIIFNKSDLCNLPIQWPGVSENQEVAEEEILQISALEKQDVTKVKHQIIKALNLQTNQHDFFVSFNKRQSLCMKGILSALIMAESMLIHDADLEIVAIKIREALEKLAEMTGKGVEQQLLDHIFSQFCIGK